MEAHELEHVEEKNGWIATVPGAWGSPAQGVQVHQRFSSLRTENV